ncbi:hypothetical protein FDP41_002251 [Naegleria fowleri]|uniref:Uncharacterized protein n=1 Tax=Naegleria fowleri TaxID=5763 RepID=A0A6A5BVI5_NAEFO|nr:uncharacterized protein FDP41_002251 [Naegleria fowleri]KAF0978431.1 hypothetical protein FDP41_002251 [Naegleria fowleri]
METDPTGPNNNNPIRDHAQCGEQKEGNLSLGNNKSTEDPNAPLKLKTHEYFSKLETLCVDTVLGKIDPQALLEQAKQQCPSELDVLAQHVEKGFTQALKEKIKEISDENGLLTRQLEEQKQDISSKDKEIESLEESKRTLTTRKKDLKTKLNEERNNSRKLENQIEILKKEVKNLKKERSNLASQVQEAEKNCKNLHSQLDEKNHTIVDLNKQVKDLNHKVMVMQPSNEIIELLKTATHSRTLQLEKDVKELRKQTQEDEKQIKKLNKEALDNEKQIENLKKDMTFKENKFNNALKQKDLDHQNELKNKQNTHEWEINNLKTKHEKLMKEKNEEIETMIKDFNMKKEALLQEKKVFEKKIEDLEGDLMLARAQNDPALTMNDFSGSTPQMIANNYNDLRDLLSKFVSDIGDQYKEALNKELPENIIESLEDDLFNMIFKTETVNNMKEIASKDVKDAKEIPKVLKNQDKNQKYVKGLKEEINKMIMKLPEVNSKMIKCLEKSLNEICQETLNLYGGMIGNSKMEFVWPQVGDYFNPFEQEAHNAVKHVVIDMILHPSLMYPSSKTVFVRAKVIVKERKTR